MKPIEVAIQASDPLTRCGALGLLRSCADVHVLAETEAERAGVLVVMEERVTEEVLLELRRSVQASTGTGPRVVLVVDEFGARDLMSVIECGLVVVLPRRKTGGAELSAAVISAAQGCAYMDPALLGALLQQVQMMLREVLEPNGLTFSGLLVRERDVLSLVADGFSTAEIATKLSYSERTVKNILYGLMTRRQLNNRAHAVAYALSIDAI